MLDPPPHSGAFFGLGVVLASTFGLACSDIRVWHRLFPRVRGKGLGSSEDGRGGERSIGSKLPALSVAYATYLKSGEYGESDSFPYSWSPFVEPLNSWTSLAMSIFGIVILCVGVQDLLMEGIAPNVTAAHPGFSILYGLSSITLGVASFLFHASHAETW